MAELGNGPVKTFSVGFEEEEYSELPCARAVAERYATDHHEFNLSYSELPNTLEKIASHFGEPFADASAIPLYHLSLLTRQTITVALNGDGGDEDFGGYQRYWLDPLADLYLRGPRLLTKRLFPWLVRGLRDTSNRPIGQSPIQGLKHLEQLTSINQRASILRWGSYFSPRQRMELWRMELWNEFRADNAAELIIEAYEKGQGSNLDRTLRADVHTYLPGDLLVKADRMTMAASLEGRSPFLDQELVAWAARLPDKYKVRGFGGKYLLKKAFNADLPEIVKSHRKQGFGIPLAAWFRGPLRQWSQELLLGGESPLRQWFDLKAVQTLMNEHTQGRMDHGKRLYALSMLTIWAREPVQ
jgi:asparagine synthase (glutamine-hydrolysing)